MTVRRDTTGSAEDCGDPQGDPGNSFAQVVDVEGRAPFASWRGWQAQDLAIYPDERGPDLCRLPARRAAFLARLGVRIEQVMTDNANNYVASRAFQAALAETGAGHKRMPAYSSQLNGKSAWLAGRCSTSRPTLGRTSRTTSG